MDMGRALHRIGFLALIGGATLGLSQSDWKTTPSREGSITVSLPPTWVVSDPGNAETARRLEEFKTSNPRLGQLMDPKANERQILLALDPSASAGRIDSLNILKNPSAGLSPDMYGLVADALKSSLGTNMVGEFHSAQIDLPVGKSFKYWMTMRAKVGASETTLDLYNVMFVKGDLLYVVTFATEAGQLAKRRDQWDKIIASLRAK